MKNIRVSVAGISSLLGQNLVKDLLFDPNFVIESVHDTPTDENRDLLADIVRQTQAVLDLGEKAAIPLLETSAPARAPVLLSFLPDAIGEQAESAHLKRNTLVISHCEYARRLAPLAMPGISPFDKTARHVATPNCTTAICAAPIGLLDQAFGVTRATITTLQAISGTDLPGMHASAIHDQVIGHLDGEADALFDELRLLFRHAFPVEVFATRVPVWRGHTITVALALGERPDLAMIKSVLTTSGAIKLSDPRQRRDRFSADGTLAEIIAIRPSQDGVMLTIKGDNLGAATVGVMHALAKQIS